MKVSVICPYWNRQHTIARCIASVLNQTMDDFEFILVDDGSSSPPDLGACNIHDPRIRVTHHRSNLGPAAARNTGARMAAGKWLAFIDSDDEWLPNKLERQLAFAELHAGSTVPQAFVTGVESRDHGSTSRCIPRGAQSLADFSAGCWYSPGSTLMIERDRFVALGLLDDRLSRLEDYEFFLRFGSADGVLLVLPEALSTIYVASSPDVRRVDAAARLIVARYGRSTAIERRVRRNIISFCHLARASAHYRIHRYAGAIIHYALSLFLVPRLGIHLIDRFVDSRQLRPQRERR